jgi:hypothetical protein
MSFSPPLVAGIFSEQRECASLTVGIARKRNIPNLLKYRDVLD